VRRLPTCALALALAVAIYVLVSTAGCASHGLADVESPLIPSVVPETSAKIEEDADERLARLCDAKTRIDVGPADVAFSSYPCEVAKTQAAVEATQGKGVIMGTLPRFFLRVRLVTRGIFSSIFGLVGIG
jgi:hypothetical protein